MLVTSSGGGGRKFVKQISFGFFTLSILFVAPDMPGIQDSEQARDWLNSTVDSLVQTIGALSLVDTGAGLEKQGLSLSVERERRRDPLDRGVVTR